MARNSSRNVWNWPRAKASSGRITNSPIRQPERHCRKKLIAKRLVMTSSAREFTSANRIKGWLADGRSRELHTLVAAFTYDTNVKTAWVVVATSVAVILTTG